MSPDDTIVEAVARVTKERDDAWLRLGVLGLKPKFDADLADLCKRLGTMVIPPHKSWPTHHANPDGPEAVAVIERLSARAEAAEALLAKAREALEDKDEALGKIVQWADAYPVDIFREPDLDAVNALLKASDMGVQMDRMHASWARHLITGIGDIARAVCREIGGEAVA